MDYSPSHEYSSAFGEVDIPEGKKLKEKQVNTGKVLRWGPKVIEGKVSRRKVLNLYTKSSRRPLYSLQVLCMIAISRKNHPKEEIYTLDYTFKDPDLIMQILDPYPRPIGFNLQPYTGLQLERYIKPRYLDWVRAGISSKPGVVRKSILH